jgi:hypothetical protein
MMAGAKWPGNEFNYSPPSSVEVKDEYSYTTIPLHAFGVCMETNVLFFSFFAPYVGWYCPSGNA